MKIELWSLAALASFASATPMDTSPGAAGRNACVRMANLALGIKTTQMRRDRLREVVVACRQTTAIAPGHLSPLPGRDCGPSQAEYLMESFLDPGDVDFAKRAYVRSIGGECPEV